MNVFGRKINRMVTTVLESVPQGSAIDLGCANGATAYFLAERGWQTIGIDLKLPPDLPRHDRLQFFESDICSFDWSTPAAISLVVAANVLQFLSRKAKYELMDKAWRALQPGGVFIIESFTTADPGFKRADLSKRSYFEPDELQTWAAGRGAKEIGYVEGLVDDDHPPLGPHQHGVVKGAWAKIPGDL